MKKVIIIILLFYSVVGFSQKPNKAVLQEIKSKAAASHSDAVIIIQDGTVLYNDYFEKEEKPIYIASAGKSLTSLAIGKLLDEKLLDSLDQPIHSIYPQWKQGNKKDITVRMLLNHTSGMQNNPNASVELEPAPNYKVHNIIELALSAELTDRPGEKVSYNNKAVALLGGIVQELSGKSFDEFFIEKFFNPMDIVHYNWIKDESGNPTVHGAFVIKPSDLLKFGELILNKGNYQGEQIISEEWIAESFKQSQPFSPIWGLLWWRLPAFEKRIIDEEIWSTWEAAGVDKTFLDKMQSMKEELYESKFDFYNALERTLGEDWNHILNKHLPVTVQSSKRIYSDEIIAYYADGFRGNYLVIIPEAKIIAVRCADSEGFDYSSDFFTDFVQLVAELNK